MYNIQNLSSEQARVVIRALDLYSRLSIGQIGECGSVMMNLHFDRIHDKITQWDLQKAFDKTFKPIIGLNHDEHLGMGHQSQHEDGKIAYDIECVLRKVVASVEEHDKISVWHRDPLHYSQQPLPIVTASNESTTSISSE